MTRQEFTGTRDLTMSGWIRKNLPDSGTGFLCSDLDFILQNYKTKKIMILEIKTRNAELKTWQRLLFENIDKWIRKGIDAEWKYYGFHCIRFENTFFNDGYCLLDNIIKTENDIKIFLSMADKDFIL